MALYNLTDEQVQLIQNSILHNFPLSSDAPECDLADLAATALQTPVTKIFYVVWNGTMVYSETDEVTYHKFLTETIGMSDQFIEEHMDGGEYTIYFSDKPDEDDDETVSGWKWSPDRGDDYIELEIGSSEIGKY